MLENDGNGGYFRIFDYIIKNGIMINIILNIILKILDI